MSEAGAGRAGGLPLREDLLVTDAFCFVGTVEGKVQRLSRLLEDRPPFLSLREASRIDLETGEEVESPQFLVNLEHLVLAHEFVDLSGDEGWKMLSRERELARIQVETQGKFSFRLTGLVPRENLAAPLLEERSLFVLRDPEIQARSPLPEKARSLLGKLSYVLLQKRRVSNLFGLGSA